MQENYRWPMAGVLILLSALTAAGTVSSAATDPLLKREQGPCAPYAADPDYVPGTDIDGHPVAPAGLPQPRLGVPQAMLVPLPQSPNGQEKGWVSLDRGQLDSLLNPSPACPPQKP